MKRAASKNIQNEVTEPVFYNNNKDKMLSFRRNSNIIPVSIVLFISICSTVVSYSHTWLPIAKPTNIPLTDFSEGRARRDLSQLMSFGIRTVGSVANEVDCPKFLLSQILKIQAQALTQNLKMEVEVQHPEGAFGLFFISQFQNIYSNITNILVRLSPNSTNSSKALLMSSHYDAAVGAKAASDDGVNVVIMLELLRNFVANPLDNISLIFNFNGAEETILQASHGFITQHRWAKDITAFINMEAAGAGGREILFQTGSSTLSKAYARGAPYPFGSALAQEIFDKGLIPSDTDFRIYRDFGGEGIAGMDFAYIANGYVYHTSLDDISQIQSGSIQRFGDNLIGTIGLLDATSLQHNSSSANEFMFDVLGLVMVTIPHRTACIWTSLAMLSGLIFVLQRNGHYVDALVFLLQVNVVGTIISLAVAILLTLVAPMSWYATPILFQFLFIPPFVLSYVIKLQRQRALSEAALFSAYLTGWLVVCIMMLYYQSSFMIPASLFVVFPLISRVVIPNQPVKSCFIGTLVPLCYTLQLRIVVLEFFVPLMGRVGTRIPPDIVICVIVSIFTIFCLSYIGSLLTLCEPKCLKNLQVLLVSIIMSSVIVAALINPYSSKCPKRVFLQHTIRSFQDSTNDTGLWVYPVDYLGNAPVSSYFSQISGSPGFAAQVAPPAKPTVDLYDNLPWLFPKRKVAPAAVTWYLPVTAPEIPKLRASLVLIKRKKHLLLTRFHFVLTGPALMTVFIDAKNTTITKWSIGNGSSESPIHESDTYFMHFVTGSSPALFHFWIETTSEVLQVAWAGFYTDESTPEIDAAKASLPSFMDPIASISTWDTKTF